MRLLLPLCGLLLLPSTVQAQYAGSTIGVVVTGASANDELTLGGQLSLGLEGEHRMGVGNWKGTYRATVGYAESFRATGSSLFPARVDAGLRYDFLEDRRRPFFGAAFSYWQLTNPPSGYAEPTRLVAPALRLGYEHYLATEISLSFEVGGAWFIVIDGDDPVVLDYGIGLRTHY
tara:strand:- start:342 stop:866 length:525 start_codon:yes stop_codon:yes gene_type:complete